MNEEEGASEHSGSDRLVRKARYYELAALWTVGGGFFLGAMAVWFYTYGRRSEAFGDTIAGTAGVVFALAGVLLFYSALQFQRAELKLQMEEMKNTTIALKEQREEMIKTRKATATLEFARRLEAAKRRRRTVVIELLDYYRSSDRKTKNFAWKVVPDAEEGTMLPIDVIADRWMAKGWKNLAEPLDEMLSLMAESRLAWNEDLVDKEDLAEILKPELNDLRELYHFGALAGSMTVLDRYVNGHDWLEEVCRAANVGRSSA